MSYRINNLACKYKTGKNPVLLVENLEINKGKVVFFLGASGVGKSTILETLGLMNNTILANPKTKFDFFDNSSTINMINIWDKRESFLAKFRKKHLSFIFQSTNLFPNLNAEENVLLTPMLQSLPQFKAKNKVRPIFKNIFTKEYKEILSNKKISEMSGGQRQRLAFVRAIASNYTVLLADEPTGNLDWANANNLMKHLIEDIKSKGATSIIVSHDIALAVEHADKIVYIDKVLNSDSQDPKKHYHFGHISNANTYVGSQKSGWVNQLSYGDNKPPIIDSKTLIEFFKEKIIKQNIEDHG